jgi:hypothetical protein
MKNINIKTLEELRNSTAKGCRFTSFLYCSRTTGETSRYTINLGIDYRSACEHDLLAIESYTPKDSIETEAKEKIVASLRETLTEGVSKSYTQKDSFENIGKGIKQHKETGEIYIYGFVQQKEQIAEPINPRKPVNSKPLTIAKNRIEKLCGFKRTRFAQFILSADNIAGIKVNGNLIVLY